MAWSKDQQAEIKAEFPIFTEYPELVYLDSAATAQKPKSVIKALTVFYERHNANVHRGIYDLSEGATQMYEQARERVANFVGAAPEEVVFTSGSTASSNLIAQSRVTEKLETGDVVLSSTTEHHSNFLPIFVASQKARAKIELIGLADNHQSGHLFDWIDCEQKLKKYRDQVKFIALSSVSNVLGEKLDIARLVELKESYSPSAEIILDLAQQVGHGEFDFLESGVDFTFFSGHKLLAETGIGVLIGKKAVLAEMPPTFLGGGMIATVSSNEFSTAPPPQRFEAGTPHISGVISLASACEFLTNLPGGLAAVEDHEHQLSQRALDILTEIPAIKILGPTAAENRGGLVAFTVEGVHPHDLAELLNSKNIAVRAGHHCAQILHRETLDINASTRVSFHVYNSVEDIEKFGSALKNTLNFLRK